MHGERCSVIKDVTAQPTSPAAWEAARKAESAKAVADGGRPLMRIGSAPVPHSSWGRPVDVVFVKDGVLYRDSHYGSLHVETAEHLQSVDELRVVVFADQGALRLAVKTLENAGAQQAARAIPYLVRQGYTSSFVCLTTSLAVRWWDPFRGKGLLQQWAKAMGASGASTPQTVRHLYALLASGELPSVSVDAAAGKLAQVAKLPGLANQFKAYDLARALSEQWAAMLRRDPNLLGRYLLSGEVVRCDPLRFGGGLILGRLSTPCKLRSGSSGKVLVFDNNGLEVAVDLKRFLAHDDHGNEGLFAELRVGKWGRGADTLLRSWQMGGSWLLTEAPMAPRSSHRRAMWLVGKRSVPAADTTGTSVREAPVDVVLAGS